jgi:hypothetical protein
MRLLNLAIVFAIILLALPGKAKECSEADENNAVIQFLDAYVKRTHSNIKIIPITFKSRLPYNPIDWAYMAADLITSSPHTKFVVTFKYIEERKTKSGYIDVFDNTVKSTNTHSIEIRKLSLDSDVTINMWESAGAGRSGWDLQQSVLAPSYFMSV